MFVLDLLMQFFGEQMFVSWNPLFKHSLPNVGQKFTKASLAPDV